MLLSKSCLTVNHATEVDLVAVEALIESAGVQCVFKELAMVVATFLDALRLVQSLVLCDLECLLFNLEFLFLDLDDLVSDLLALDILSDLSLAARASQEGEGHLESRPLVLYELKDAVSVEDVSTGELDTRLGAQVACVAHSTELIACLASDFWVGTL